MVNEKSVKVLLIVSLMLASSVPATMLFAETEGDVPIYASDYDLVARRTTTAPVIDGTVDPVWSNAIPVEGFTSGGSGAIFVDIKAMFDDDYIYFLASWDEPQFPESPKPDVDREAWELTSNVTPGTWDNKTWGEDRISFFFQDPDDIVVNFTDQGCDAICHDLEAMYTKTSGEMLDAWVWSAATTNPQGYADDGVLLFNGSVTIDNKTMHVRQSDMAWDAGGDGWYVNNDTTSATMRPSYVWKPGAAPADPSFMFMTDAVEVDWGTFDITTIPQDTMVPGHVLMYPTGDRADVQAKGIHNGTGWNVEFKRLRDTGSSDDVAFDRTNVAYVFGPAIANNRSGEDHSKGIHPYNLWLAEPELPDLIIGNMNPEGSSHTVNSTIDLGVWVENIGWADAGTSRISYQWENGSGVPTGPMWYADTEAVPWGKDKHVGIEVNTSGLDPGNWTLNVTADADGDVNEIDETNNWLTMEFELGDELLPNLAVTDVSMEPAELTPGAFAEVTVMVVNDGTADAPAAEIIVYLDDPASPLAEDMIPTLAIDDDHQYVVNVGPFDLAEGEYVLNVTVDPDGLIKELDEDDNTMGLAFNVTAPTLPDLVIEAVTPIDITVTQGEQTRTQVVVANTGGAPVTDDFEVALFLNQATTIGTLGLMATAQVTDDIPAGENVTLVMTWTVPPDTAVGSDHFLRAEADWIKAVEELDESNNNGTFNGLVVKRRSLPDLTIAQVFPLDPSVKIKGRVTFTATIKNIGSLASSNTTLEVKDITHNRTLDRVPVKGLEVDETVDIEYSWFVTNVPEGELTLRFLVDPDDMIDEENEFNNAYNVNVTILPPDLPDLTFTEEDPVVFTPAEPRVGESVTISVSVTNIGTNASTDTTLDVLLGNKVIATAGLMALGVGEKRTIDVPWSTSEIQSPYEYIITVHLDPDNRVPELNISNNDYNTTITFVSPPSAVLDNLVVTADPTEVEDGGETTITVTVENTGDAPALITIGIKDGVTEVDSKQGVTVPAGGSKTETFKLKLEGTGDHVMTATVYVGDEVAKDPSGNDLVDDATVKVTEKEEAGSNSMLIVAVVVIILVAMVAVVLFMRRK